ncbi:MAG: hypothetical protein K0Q57_1016, partial [Gammaproteobacteria bacterium]|nr:hypothetical protein [Gammaproteobacteria bacterium]
MFNQYSVMDVDTEMKELVDMFARTSLNLNQVASSKATIGRDSRASLCSMDAASSLSATSDPISLYSSDPASLAKSPASMAVKLSEGIFEPKPRAAQAFFNVEQRKIGVKEKRQDTARVKLELGNRLIGERKA